MESYFNKLPRGRLFSYQSYMFVSSLAKEVLLKKSAPSVDWLSLPDQINRKLLIEASRVFPLSNSELRQLEADLGMKIDQNKVIIVPNGLTFREPQEQLRTIDVLVVGRIEPRKNMLKIARTLSNSSYRVTFVGKANANHPRYNQEFLSVIASSENLTYEGERDQLALADLYSRSHVCLSNSWFEVVSQVDLEAVSLGCKPIVSRASAIFDYFDGDVLSLLPDCTAEDLIETVKLAMSPDYSPSLRESYVHDWTSVVEMLVAAYHQVRTSSARPEIAH